MKPFIAIAALSLNRVIGVQGKLPWHLPEDLQWFKKLTLHQTIVMGRKTYESTGRPLPKRRSIVLSRSSIPIPGVEVVPSLESIPNDAWAPEVFIVGGGEIYQLALPFCSTLYLTRVNLTVDGDAYFPPFESDFHLSETIQKTPEFTIERWSKNS